MDGGPTALVKFLFPQIPNLLKQTVSHSLSLKPTSSKWDLRTTLTVEVLRSMTSGNKVSPLGKIQKGSLRDAGVKGKVWIAKATIPAAQDETIRDALFAAIADMGEAGTDYDYTKPDNAAFQAEWTGFRADAGPEEGLPDISEQERYAKLMAEPSRKSKTTILYFHGGAYYLCGFGTHRASVSKLAKACGGRALNIEYRLAPQAAFPAQLLDALNAYLYLIYPPEGALHEPVPASDIVFAGDSAGGNLSFALLQLLLQMHRSKPQGQANPTAKYNGKEVDVPLPAGVTALSGWFDITRSMPSLTTNAKYDFLPPANHDDAVSVFPSDAIWPTTPPRGDIFADLSMICHPLCSPLAAQDWSGSPPLWIMTGEELLADEDKVVAARAASQGATVQWEQYEAMPHTFIQLLPALPTSARCYKSWGDFSRQCVEGDVKSSATWIAAKTGAESAVEITKITDLQFDDVVSMMKASQSRRLKGYEKEGKTMPKPSL